MKSEEPREGRGQSQRDKYCLGDSIFPNSEVKRTLSPLCPQPSRAPTSLGVKAQVLPVAHRDLHDLPCPLSALPSSLSSPRSLCSSHMGVLTVPPEHQAGPCPRTFAHVAPSAHNTVPSVSMWLTISPHAGTFLKGLFSRDTHKRLSSTTHEAQLTTLMLV